MKKLMTLFVAFVAATFALSAQTALNNKADSILGDFENRVAGDEYRVHFTKNADGSYTGTIYWIKDDIDPKTGDCWKDIHNPDKSLRDRYTHSIPIVEGLKYNAEKKQWDRGKIYDPNRGIKVNLTARFDADGSLTLKGTVLGIGETVKWYPVK